MLLWLFIICQISTDDEGLVLPEVEEEIIWDWLYTYEIVMHIKKNVIVKM